MDFDESCLKPKTNIQFSNEIPGVAGKILWKKLCRDQALRTWQYFDIFFEKVIRFQRISTRFSPERPCWELSCLVAWNAVLHLWICHFIRGRVTSFVDTSRVFCFSHSTWVRDTKSQHMACRDWECFLSSRRAILYSRPGKSRVKWWVRYLLENFTKMVIIFDPTDGFWWELSQTEKKYSAFEWDAWCC